MLEVDIACTIFFLIGTCMANVSWNHGETAVGAIGFFAVYQSVCPFVYCMCVCLSIRPSVRQFTRFSLVFSVVLLYIDLKFGI